MAVRDLPPAKFVRKTTLDANEYNTNFRMIDRDVLAAVSSAEADAVTPLISKVYLRLLQTPAACVEREGVLRFEGETQEGKWVKAWDQLCRHLRVSGETARKALCWLHDQGVIGYSAFKNGVGIRIFLNRAASSIAIRPAARCEKNLPADRASVAGGRASAGDTAFRDSYAVLEDLEKYENPDAPKSGADAPTIFPTTSDRSVAIKTNPTSFATPQHTTPAIPVELIVEHLKRELAPCVQTAAAHAAAQAAAREHAQTREWLDKCGIPKATRVAQKEAFDVLRRHGMIEKDNARARLAVGGGAIDRQDAGGFVSPRAARPLAQHEIAELAATCVALYESQGKAIEDTLRGAGAEAGGWVSADDVLKVYQAAHRLLGSGDTGAGGINGEPPRATPSIAAAHAPARGCG